MFTMSRAPLQGGGAARRGSGRRRVGGGKQVPIPTSPVPKSGLAAPKRFTTRAEKKKIEERARARACTTAPLTAAAADGQLPQAKRVSEPPVLRDA
jgi:hypothetical protein